MIKNKQEKITYKTRPIRLSDETWEKLKKQKIKYGKSWNLFIVKLLEKNGINS